MKVETDARDAAPTLSKILVLLGAVSVLSPFALDVYLPALPAIAAELRASAGAVEFTLPAYYIGMAISQLFFGSIADRVGRRTPLLFGLGLLVAGSAGCAVAPDIVWLTLWRIVQALGVGSASVIPRAIVRDRFGVAHTARALSLLGLITGVGPILAPQVGGLILLAAGWRFEFWFLACFGTACWVAVYYLLAESLPAQRPAAIGPRLWLRLLTDRRYVRFALPANLVQSSLFAYLAGAPFVFIHLLHLTPQQFAWTFGCNAAGVMVAGRINAYILPRFGPELIFRHSMAATAAIGVLLFAVAWSGGGFWSLSVPLFFFVSMLGFNFSNGLALTLAPFGGSAGTASALFGTVQFIIAGLAGSLVSSLYDGSARAMTGVMCVGALAGLAIYHSMRVTATDAIIQA